MEGAKAIENLCAQSCKPFSLLCLRLRASCDVLARGLKSTVLRLLTHKERVMSVRWISMGLLLAVVLTSTMVGCTRPTGPKKGVSTTTGK